MSHHMAVVYKHAIISMIFITFHMTIASPHITLIAAERASLKRASEAADLICVCRREFISNHVYRRALWSCAFGNAQNTFTHLCFVTNCVLCSEGIMFQTGCLKNRN